VSRLDDGLSGLADSAGDIATLSPHPRIRTWVRLKAASSAIHGPRERIRELPHRAQTALHGAAHDALLGSLTGAPTYDLVLALPSAAEPVHRDVEIAQQHVDLRPFEAEPCAAVLDPAPWGGRVHLSEASEGARSMRPRQ